jgi:hypothetical protein
MEVVMNADVQETKRAEGKVSAQIHQRDVRLNVPLLGTLALPPLDHLAFYAGIGVLAALEIVEWPVALVIATGHAWPPTSTTGPSKNSARPSNRFEDPSLWCESGASRAPGQRGGNRQGRGPVSRFVRSRWSGAGAGQ